MGGRGRVPGGAEVVAGRRVPVGQAGVFNGGTWRAPGGAEVVAGRRVPVGRSGVQARGKARAHGGAGLAAGQWVPGGRAGDSGDWPFQVSLRGGFQVLSMTSNSPPPTTHVEALSVHRSADRRTTKTPEQLAALRGA